jgi:hypothetical protein
MDPCGLRANGELLPAAVAAAEAEERNMLSEVEASYVRNLTSSRSWNVPV